MTIRVRSFRRLPRCFRCGRGIKNRSLRDALTSIVRSGRSAGARLAVSCPSCPPAVIAPCRSIVEVCA